MKFYFCETCGKRLTEKDLSSGLGRDKKLKGVFCTSCAVGVTTMDSLPLTQDQAHEILEAEPPSRPQPSADRRVKRPTSGSRIPAARTGERASGAALPPAVPQQFTPLLLFGIGVGVFGAIAVIAGVLLFSEKRAEKPKARTGKPLVEEQPDAVQDTGEGTTVKSASKTEGGDVDETGASAPAEKSGETKPVPAQEAAQAAFDRLERLDTDGVANEERVEAAKAFLESHGDALLAARVRVMLNRWQDSSPAPTANASEVPETLEKAPPEKSPSKKPEPPEVTTADAGKTAESGDGTKAGLSTQESVEEPKKSTKPEPTKQATTEPGVPKPETGFKLTRLAPTDSGLTDNYRSGSSISRLCPPVDLNGDGWLDLVCYSIHGKGAMVWLNQGKGIFALDSVPISTRWIFGSRGPLWWDFNNDKRMDAINRYVGGPDRRFCSNGPSGEWVVHNSALPAYGTFLDLDGDGHHEEMWSDEGRGYLLQPKMRGWRSLPPARIPKVVQKWDPDSLLAHFKKSGKKAPCWSTAYSVDLNGDHVNELILNSSGHVRVLARRYRMAGIGAWEDATSKKGLPTDGGHRLKPVDLEPDGDLDLVDCISGFYFLNNGKGEFKKSDKRIDTHRGHPWQSRWKNADGKLRLWDLNNDGRQDPWLCTGIPYLNLGKEKFVGQPGFRRGFESMIFADLDGDFDLDMVQIGKSSLEVFRNETPNGGLVLFLVPRIYPSTPLGTKIWVYKAGHWGKPEHLIHYSQAFMDYGPRTGVAKLGNDFHIGIGKHEAVDIRIRFPSGTVRNKRGVKAMTRVRIAE